MTSGRLYSAVTKYWPRIAAGVVAVIGLVEVVIGGLTADSGVEIYLMAWAATTGGVWFLFEKAEKSLSDESRTGVADWMASADFASAIGTMPSQFASLFDRVFGEKHLTLACFLRSAVATTASVVVTSIVFWGAVVAPQSSSVGTLWSLVAYFAPLVAFSTAAAIVVNLIPDYVSLFETRWLLGRARARGRLGLVLFVDLIVTGVIAFAVYVPVLLVGLDQRFDTDWDLTTVAALGLPSTFFTSVWLWLYAASVPLSRLLLRMNSGLGFLLRVTDVERQPFRSLGFVSVIIVSGLFALGLPLVLL